LRICPDIDTIMYTLSGVVNREFGWGVADDSRNMLSMLQRYGEAPWFTLGDKDLATHLLRTQWLREGRRLTDITRQLTTALGIQHPILPMTDDEAPTRVDTAEYGELEFQEYFVRYRWQPVIRKIHYTGAEQANLTPEVCDALQQADAIIVGPSNPWLSIAPILALPQMKEMLLAREIPRVAVTPIINGQAVKGPAAKLMAELGYTVSAESVARYYGDLINGFVVDETDTPLQLSHTRVVSLPTFMQTDEDKVVLAQRVLHWIQGWS
ncbi:MAG: 2-phospho-L-lactate transferase, partial [Chloroflexi bacterium]